jgi:hypothetical protein
VPRDCDPTRTQTGLFEYTDNIWWRGRGLPDIIFAVRIDILFLLSVRFVRYDGASRLAFFMEECCNGGNLFICERYKVVEVVILHGAFRPGLTSWGNSFDEASKETAVHGE